MTQLSNDQLASIAHDFYLSKLNIAEISQKYNLSRYLIAKALDEAEKKGIVQIKITQGRQRNAILEREFQKRFGLTEAFILQDSDNETENNDALTSCAAKQIQIYLQNVKIAGSAWGSTIHSIISDFKEENRPDLTFVQLLGQAINDKRRKNPLAQAAAAKMHAQSRILPAPLYVLNSQLIPLLEKEPFYREARYYYQHLDLFFTGLGTFQSFKTNPFLFTNYTKDLFKDIPKNEVAGMIMGRPFDIQGHFLGNFEKHICGITMTDLMKTPIRFCVVKNRFKAQALLGALRTGIITHLVTSDTIAQKVLQNEK